MFTFYSPNFITDAAEIYIWEDASVTALSGYTETSLFDRDPDDTMDVTIPVSTNNVRFEFFPGSEVVADTLMIQNHNLKTYYIAINTSLTTEVTDGSDGDIFLSFTKQTITSVWLHVYSATSGDIVKLGQMIVAAEEYELPHNPDFANYTPILTGDRLGKEMADGGIVTYKKVQKFQARINLNFVPESDRDSLLAMHESIGSYVFVPYPTSSAWDGAAHEVNFVGDFNLFKPARNSRTTPFYAGEIAIKETPR